MLLLLIALLLALELLFHRLPALHRLPVRRVAAPEPEASLILPPAMEAIRSEATRVASSHDGEILLTFLRLEHGVEAENFLIQLRNVRILPATLVIALDESSLSLAQSYGAGAHMMPAVVDYEHTNASNANTGTRGALGGQQRAAQWRLMSVLARAGVRVWHCDVRTLWLHQPLSAASAAALPSNCDAALAASSPALHSTNRALTGDEEDQPLTAALSVFDGAPHIADWQLHMARRLEVSRPSQTALGGDGTDATFAVEDEVAILAHELQRCTTSHAQAVASGSCPRWCTLPPALFPSTLRAFQQPTDDADEGPPARVTPMAILADALPSGVPYEYRLREAGLWHLSGTPSWQRDTREVGRNPRSPAAAPGGGDDSTGGRQRPPALPARATQLQALPSSPGGVPPSPERFIAFKELLINNGLSNARNALRSALAIAQITNRTLILPPLWSRHLRGEPHRVGADYYFDISALTRHFPRVRESALLASAFPNAALWPPEPSCPLFFLRLADDERLCAEVRDSRQLEALGNVNATCPPLTLPTAQLVATTAAGYHLGADEAQIRAWLSPHAHRPLLYFARMVSPTPRPSLLTLEPAR